MDMVAPELSQNASDASGGLPHMTANNTEHGVESPSGVVVACVTMWGGVTIKSCYQHTCIIPQQRSDQS